MKNKKLFGVFNIFDFLIILAIIAVAIGITSRLRLSDKITVAASDTPMTFTVVVERIRLVSVENVEVGQGIFDSETGSRLGEITQVRGTPAFDKVELVDGSIVLTPMPERYDLRITAQGRGKVTAEGNMLNGNRHLAPGGKVIIATDKFTGEATVVACDVQRDT